MYDMMGNLFQKMVESFSYHILDQFIRLSALALFARRFLSQGMSIAGRRVVILVEFNYEDLEVHYPLLRFK